MDALAPTRILIVDDDESIVRAIRRILERDGYVVEAAGDAEAALVAVARQTPDLIVLDGHLPSMNGTEACARLRAIPATRFTQILFLTGDDSNATREAAIEAGANQFLVKPFRIDQLRVVIHSMIDLKRHADELLGHGRSA